MKNIFKRALKRLFIFNADYNQQWYKIIFWWEIRRILYNILLFVFGIFSLTILSFIVKDLNSFFPPPIFTLFGVILFFFLANVFYTGGWIFHLLTIDSKNKVINKIKPKLFVYGILFSFFIQFLPCLLTGGYTIVTGRRIKSPYADFTTEKPQFKDIVGEYEISEISKRQLNLPDSINKKVVIRFKSDSTFEFQYFPMHNFGMSLTKYQIVNAKGKWIITNDDGSWVITMYYKSITNVLTGEIDEKGFCDINGFHLNNNKPPYDIYIIIGDPDSWEGITLKKR